MASPEEIRSAFLEASQFLMRGIESVPVTAWDQPALGEWDLRELCVHACRAWLTTIQYSAETAELRLHSPLDYYVAVLDTGGDLHAGVAERAKEAAAALDDPVPQYAMGLLHEVEALLSRTADDHVIANFAGGIRFIDYLPTRVLELVVHGIDLNDAIGVESEVPPTASLVTMELLGELAATRLGAGDLVGLVRALTGRAAFGGELNLLA